jgi:hypothetical protein
MLKSTAAGHHATRGLNHPHIICSNPPALKLLM